MARLKVRPLPRAKTIPASQAISATGRTGQPVTAQAKAMRKSARDPALCFRSGETGDLGFQAVERAARHEEPGSAPCSCDQEIADCKNALRSASFSLWRMRDR